MWTETFHCFDNEAAFLAACDAAGWHGGQMASLHRPRAYPWMSPGQASNRRRWQDR